MRRNLARVLVLATAAATAATAPSTAAAAPQILAREQASFTVDAHGETIAWSSFDPASQRYRLTLWRGGTVTTPPIPTRTVPFDVDLGLLAAGSLGAVYSRCADDSRLLGCDVYLYDLDSGEERRLDTVSSRSRSETLPSLDGTLVSFARSYGRERSILYTGPIDGRPGSTREPSPRTGTASAVERSSGRLLYIWVDRTRSDFGRMSVFRTRGDRAVRMFFTESGGANFSSLIGLSYTSGLVYFAETNQGSGTGNLLYRSTLGARRLQQARGSARYASVAWIRDRFATARGLDGPSTLELTEPVVWKPATKPP